MHVSRAPQRPRSSGRAVFERPAPASLNVASLAGWRADVSQQLLVDLLVEPAPLTVIPGVASP